MLETYPAQVALFVKTGFRYFTWTNRDQRIKVKIKIRPQKINLARDHIEFLGMVWTKGKLSIPKAKTLAFQNLPSPDTPKKAKSM